MSALFRDAHWLALDKPAGMPTTPPTTRGRTLVDIAKELAPKATHHHPLSRLDADVSGVVLFALTAEAVGRARVARERGAYRREYLGLTGSALAGDSGSWTWKVSIDERDRTKRTTTVGADAQEARTDWEVLVRNSAVALVRFVPVTGRTHQIRVHAQAAGVSLLGDVAYGGERRVVMEDGAVVSAKRVMLHARRVRIPWREDWVESPMAADFTAVWEACGG